MTTNGIGLATGRPDCGRRAGPDQRLARHARSGHVQRADPAPPAARRAGRRLAARGRRAGPGQDQLRAAARSQRSRGGRSAGWAMAEGCSCASSSRCRSTPSTAGAATEMVTAAEIRARLAEQVDLVEDRAGRRDGGAHRRSCSGWPAPSYAVGIIASVTPAVLRGLRPGTADCRRPDSQLPVRPHGVGSAGSVAGRRRRRRDRRPMGPRRPRQAGRPRHRRPELPAARSADVGDRGIALEIRDLAQEPAGGQERAERVSMFGAGQPVLAPLRRMDLGVVPPEVVRRRRAAALGRAEEQVRQPSGPGPSAACPARPRRWLPR